MFYRASLQAAAALASLSLLAGCGLLSDSGSEENQKITVGTTSSPSTLDPAAAWDGSWELMRNIYQTLVSFPTGSTSPEPDAADTCTFTDATSMAYRCTLKKNLKFSNGEKLDAQAVKHSIDRVVNIHFKGGPAGMLGSLDRIETKGDDTVIFHLNKSDATFPFILATPAMSLVAPGDYPKDKIRDDGKITGSGPYLLDSYEAGVAAELTKNPDYKGFANRKNNAVTIRYFEKSGEMVNALKSKDIDATYRGLTAEEVVGLEDKKEGDDGLQIIETTGADIRFLVFNPKDPAAAKPAVRKAIAHIVDRDALVAKVYRGTAEPLYSMIPKGISGHTTSFFDTFGDPDVKKAKEILTEAGITEPVKMTFWYTTDRYGSSTQPEFEELERQLEKTGLFEITLESAPWKTFQEGFTQGEYPVFGRGWFPDFPDPDNFIAPFVGEESVTGTPYRNKEITQQLIPATRQESDRGAVSKQFERAQQILVDDVRLLPLWQGKLYVASGEDIGGGERALDPQTVMQMWELYRKASW
ncbi:ABC transporter substrate-binding protein [Streptomyces sp. NPDC012389]|uniref:ABC transporter substrate-binding protein n=1 Tax=unclassified Streptomyces TaxID=2593676 RepID=UPI00081E0A0C|nr:ABC transporter substrate-binding protein [Streptomyces sp. ScaeMP-e83]MYR98636.1 peptide-binding protein [Streptomyces sp. SID4937]MYX12418.1 peptide-binding protein [Streptomyces sp. SID8374]SCE40351.1 peptide/nickel transport system substrate-binding protein [Streptomyces sp. ScaeMP-e83]